MHQSPPTAFRGWRILGWSTLILALTAPGQTIGVSSFIDHMIDDLGVSRSTLSGAYLVATLLGSAALPAIGRWVDRRGVRHATTVVGVAFAFAIALLGAAQNLLMLGMAFVGIRMLGQGSLSLIGDTSIALWFQARRGRAFAVAMTVSAGLMALSPLVFTALIEAVGWRPALVVTAVFIVLTVPSIGRFAMVDRPSAIGQVPDGIPGVTTETFVPQPSLTVRAAVRTPAFASLMSIVALSAALITGLTFHNVSVMAEGGLTDTEAAAIFVPQMVGVVSASFVVGWLTDRVRAQVLVPFAGLSLAAAVAMATAVSPGVAAILYGLVSGIAGGSIRALGSALLPKWFGTDHIGAIRGISHTVAVAASATGPLLLSIGNDLSDSYRSVLLICAAVTAAIAVSTALVKDPVVAEALPDLVT
ncbi:MAG: MFS transporter [Acidimicrobiia bacterium]|nr:MFS transporter [Acidimicrobiia bacterium]MDH5236385.1 MFS transporter [Acidimicrobiia bacterium]